MKNLTEFETKALLLHWDAFAKYRAFFGAFKGMPTPCGLCPDKKLGHTDNPHIFASPRVRF